MGDQIDDTAVGDLIRGRGSGGVSDEEWERVAFINRERRIMKDSNRLKQIDLVLAEKQAAEDAAQSDEDHIKAITYEAGEIRKKLREAEDQAYLQSNIDQHNRNCIRFYQDILRYNALVREVVAAGALLVEHYERCRKRPGGSSIDTLGEVVLKSPVPSQFSLPEKSLLELVPQNVDMIKKGAENYEIEIESEKDPNEL